MTLEQAEGHYHQIALDVTKIWPHAEFPLRAIGRLVVNRNPENFFDEIEQVGDFCHLTDLVVTGSISN